MIEAIPVIGELPFDDILQMAESFMEDLSQNYDASYTVALRDDYRCDLFCLAKNNDCILTFQIAFDYFSSELGEEITTLDLEDLLEFFTQGIFSGVEIVHAFHAFVTGLMLFGASILNMDSVKIARLMGAIWNDPDNDWSILCTDCGWTHTFDFTVNDGGFVPLNIWSASPHAVYVNGVGWQTQDIPVTGADFRRVCIIKREFTESSLTEVSMTYNLTKGTTSVSLATNTAINAAMRLATVVQASNPTTFENSVTADGQVKQVIATEQADDITFNVSSSARTTPVYTGSATIVSCTVKGTGTNPFI